MAPQTIWHHGQFDTRTIWHRSEVLITITTTITIAIAITMKTPRYKGLDVKLTWSSDKSQMCSFLRCATSQLPDDDDGLYGLKGGKKGGKMS